MLTRRQKNSLRGITAALTCSAMLAGFLIYTNISNTEKTVPVVFSDILEGAVDYSDENDIPEVTLGSDALLETMFAEQEAEAVILNNPYTTTAPSNNDTGTYTTRDNAHYAEVTYSSAGERVEPELQTELTLLSNDPNSHDTFTSSSTTNETTTESVNNTENTEPVIISIDTEETPYFLSTSQPTDTTADTTTTEISSATTTTTQATTTTTKATTTVTTTTKATTTTTKATTKATTTTAKTTTTTHESKAPFTNVGGGKFYTNDDIYLKMFRLVNNARREAGLKELWYSARVHEVCELRTSELTSYYSHTRPDGTRFSTAFKDIGITFQKCGENIAYGRNMFDTPEEVFIAWMDSPSHKENILSPDFECCAFGLSILKVGNDTYYYWAQEFAKL